MSQTYNTSGDFITLATINRAQQDKGKPSRSHPKVQEYCKQGLRESTRRRLRLYRQKQEKETTTDKHQRFESEVPLQAILSQSFTWECLIKTSAPYLVLHWWSESVFQSVRLYCRAASLTNITIFCYQSHVNQPTGLVSVPPPGPATPVTDKAMSAYPS